LKKKKNNKKPSKQIKCLLTPHCASTVCVCSPGQPTGSTTAKSAKSATQRAEPNHFPTTFPSGGKEPNPAPYLLDPQQMPRALPPSRHHVGALPHRTQPASGLRGLLDPAEHGDLACAQPLPTNCRASWTCHGARTSRAQGPQPCRALPFEWGAAAAASRAWGWLGHRLPAAVLLIIPATRTAGVTMISTSSRIKP